MCGVSGVAIAKCYIVSFSRLLILQRDAMSVNYDEQIVDRSAIQKGYDGPRGKLGKGGETVAIIKNSLESSTSCQLPL